MTVNVCGASKTYKIEKMNLYDNKVYVVDFKDNKAIK